MRTLVVYYSLSGNTRTLATALAKELGADIEELRCSRYAPGFVGFIRAGHDSWRGHLPPVEPMSRAPSQYDLVVIAGPIWAWHAATPVRAWLTRERDRLPRVAFLLTHGGAGGEKSLQELTEITGGAPVAGLVVKERDIKGQRFGEALRTFTAQLRTTEAAGGLQSQDGKPMSGRRIMKVNETPGYDSSDNPTGCCPRFKPTGWDGEELHFSDKLFARAVTRSLFHIPINMTAVFARTSAAIDAAGARSDNGFLVLSRELSPWTSEHYFAVTHEVPGLEMRRLSGDFLTKVFEGPYSRAPAWMKALESAVASRGKNLGKTYFFYTTCPRCAKHYGKNYVVGVAEAC